MPPLPGKLSCFPWEAQVMNWEGLRSSWSSWQDALFSHLPGKGDCHEVFERFPSHPPDQHKGTDPPSLGRKHHFYLTTRKPWVALYESKITIFSPYASWYNEGENQPPNANDTIPPSVWGIYIKSKMYAIWVRIEIKLCKECACDMN